MNRWILAPETGLPLFIANDVWLPVPKMYRARILMLMHEARWRLLKHVDEILKAKSLDLVQENILFLTCIDNHWYLQDR